MEHLKVMISIIDYSLLYSSSYMLQAVNRDFFLSPKNCGSFLKKMSLGGARGGGRAPPKQFFEALNARGGA